MPSSVQAEHILFLLRRYRERLSVKPMIMCLWSIATVFSARVTDS